MSAEIMLLVLLVLRVFTRITSTFFLCTRSRQKLTHFKIVFRPRYLFSPLFGLQHSDVSVALILPNLNFLGDKKTMQVVVCV